MIVGEQELAEGTATVRDLRLGEQQTVPRDELVARVRTIVEAE